MQLEWRSFVVRREDILWNYLRREDILWNYLYLSQILTNCQNDNERFEIISLIKEGSVITWGHVNLHGEFDFRRYAANDSHFNLAKILSLQLA